MANATDMPNYRSGVRGVRIAPQISPGVYATPWDEIGAESIDESGRATASSTTCYSDDGKPATIDGAKGNDTMTIQFAEMSRDYQTKILGHGIDATTGAILKSKDHEGCKFATGFEVQGTIKRTRVWKLGCTSSEPAAAAFQSHGENATESPESCTVTVGGDTFEGVGFFDELVCHEGDPGFETFLDAVPTPNPGTPASIVSTKLASLAIGTLALTPAFDAGTEAYTVTTENATDTVTAIAADNGVTVAIEVNGTSHTSGNAATWESGSNTVVVTVTDDADETNATTYIVLVTKE